MSLQQLQVKWTPGGCRGCREYKSDVISEASGSLSPCAMPRQHEFSGILYIPVQTKLCNHCARFAGQIKVTESPGVRSAFVRAMAG